jgi:hypothetical protein
MEEVKRLRKERADREKRERAQKEEIQKLKNDKGRDACWRCCLLPTFAFDLLAVTCGL